MISDASHEASRVFLVVNLIRLPSVSFDAGRIRLERFQVDVLYHAAYDFWSFKGILGERYGHGPKFGAFKDLGNQVKLTPEGGFKKDRAEATYGIKSAAFDQELVVDKERTYKEARLWLADVLEVLDPKRTTKVSAHWFALYPLGNEDAAESASRKLRLRYYDKDKLDGLLPDYDRRFAGISSISLDGDKQLSVIIGAVGPPHKNRFFGVPDEERDKQWWMGLNLHLVRHNEDGLVDEGLSPMTVIEETMAEGATEYERLVVEGLGSIL